MAARSDQRLWRRKLDGDMHIVAEQPQLRLYPATLPELIDCVQMGSNPPLGGMPQARCIGSHWGISKLGVTPGFMIETATPVHEPDGDQGAPRLNRVLRDVVPGCLHAEAWRFFKYTQKVKAFDPALMPSLAEIYLFHVESGMRIHELYAFIDGDDAARDGSLAQQIAKEKDPGAVGWPDYSGSWALETMGGAGGQTICGVASTATHGGDLSYGAISDAVVALHLVGADGRQHWIERTRLRPSQLPLKLVDEDKLRRLYGDIEVHRSDDLMNAAIVACGRFGAIYSMVLRAVRQYALHEHGTKVEWSDLRQWLVNPAHPSFVALFAPPPPAVPSRFVKIDINPYGGFWHPSRHDCFIVTRTIHELDWAGKPGPLGRAERGGSNAGKGAALGVGNGWFSNPCASDNWLRTGFERMRHDFVVIRDKAAKTWLVCAAIIVFPLTPPPVRALALAAQQAAAATILAMQTLINAITLLVAIIGPLRITFGDTLAAAANACAELGLFPLFRMLYAKAADSVHEFDPEFPRTPAISYAAMDEHDYLNVGCVAPGDSIEIFFDANSPQLPQFIDLVLARVRQLEDGDLGGGAQAFGGYISLRFMSASPAFLAMQIWPRTCSIEIAGLSAVKGTETLLRTLEEDTKSFNAVLHWGQRNGWPQREIEKRFGPTAPNGTLYKWRDALSLLSEHGRWAAFSTAFTRHAGLEITKPRIGGFAASPSEGCGSEMVQVSWNAIANPPETQAFLVQTRLADGSSQRLPLPALSGSVALPFGAGRSRLTLRLERELNGEVYVDTQDLEVRGFSDGDRWDFVFSAGQRMVDGIARWAVEINLYSQTISNALRVSQVQATFAGVPSWRLRHPDMADALFTSAQNLQALPTRPVFNKNWLLFSELAATPGPAPAVTLSFIIDC